jgi:hypothetical protein
MFIHLHWSHNGTAISGTFNVAYHINYAKGHNQMIFGTEVTINQSISTPNITTIPRYMHRIDEIQITGSGLLDKSLIEVDGILTIAVIVTGIPAISGGSPNLPTLFTVDLHYQSTGIATKNKSPNFYN